MLVEFSVKNYRSFKEKQTFSMKASPYDKDTVDKENPRPRQIDKLNLLPVSAIYGANSSGKSNLLNAMGTMQDIVMSSVRINATDSLPTDTFALDESFLEEPTEFEVIFLLNNKTYRYGFVYTRKEIVKEWLYERARIKEQALFTREGTSFSIQKRFKEGEGKEGMTTANRLFLSLVAQLNGDISKQVINWFQHFSNISGTFNNYFRDYSIKLLLNNDEKTKASKEFLKQMDLGFSELKPEEHPIDDNFFPAGLPQKIKEDFIKRHPNEMMRSLKSAHKFQHKDGNTSLKLFDSEDMESEGTLKILDLSGPIIDTLVNGYTLVVDELDAKLHPFLTRKIISIFNSRRGNPNNAQLIFATHDTNLLNNEILRRDQIWFAEKSKPHEATVLKRLSEIEMSEDGEFRKVRRDRIFEKDYFDKKYGALPEVSEEFDLYKSMIETV